MSFLGARTNKSTASKPNTPGKTPEPPPARHPSAGAQASGDSRRTSSRLAQVGQPADEYELSVMGSIQKQYQADSEEAYSLETMAHSLCEHPHLDKRDIMDVGVSLSATGQVVSAAHFLVKEQWLTKITNVVSQLQELCAASAEALGDKKKMYIIDPDNTMLPVLLGARSVGDLERAWKLLIQRISRAQEKMDRNFRAYKQEELPPHSPATTDPQIYEEFRGIVEPDQVMTRLYSQVPSMSRLLTTEEQTLLEQGRNLSSAIPSPLDLKLAFPERGTEAHPSQIYYNKDGAKITETDLDALIPCRTSTIAGMHTCSEFRSSGSASPEVPYHQRSREPWGQTSDDDYQTAPTLSRNPRTQNGVRYGLLDGISSIYQRFPGSAQNWPSSRQDSDHDQPGAIDITDNEDRRPTISRPAYQPSYPSQPPADPPNFLARYTGAGGGGGDEEDDDGEGNEEAPRNRRGLNKPLGPSRFSNGPSGRPPAPPANFSSRPGGNGPPGSGPGGYSGYPGGGAGGPGGGGFNAPYGHHLPTIKTDLKLSNLPKWNGDFDTAIPYFHKILELASMGGDLPVALGFWLGQTLVPNSPVEEWYMILSPKWKAYMQVHYLNYVETIKFYFLGRP